jgi:hypothetical protein
MSHGRYDAQERLARPTAPNRRPRLRSACANTRLRSILRFLDDGLRAESMASENAWVLDEQMIRHEAELAKLEGQRVQSLETQAGAVLTVVLAVGVFAASALNRATLENHRIAVGAAVLFLLVAAGFAVAALGPRAARVSFWTWQRRYAKKERLLAAAETSLTQPLAGIAQSDAILESWRARRAVAIYVAERKALWLTGLLGLASTAEPGFDGSYGYVAISRPGLIGNATTSTR